MAVALMTGAAVAPASASTSTIPTTTVSNPAYAGYGLYQNGGYITSVIAKWNVPTVRCSPPPTPPSGTTPTPMVAIWAGLWGNSAAGWLPQVATISQCNVATPYSAAWELATNVSGGYAVSYPTSGTSAQTISNFPIAAGDHMEGEVDYLGAYDVTYDGTTYKDVSGFELDLWDLSHPVTTGGPPEHFYMDIYTNKQVPEVDTDQLGGAILEDHNSDGGLANFGSPPLATGGGSATISIVSLTATGSSSLSAYEFEMYVFGRELATTGPLSSSYSFTVTFDCNGCLAGQACPPPTCYKY
jgi:hypothetical protein